MAENVADHRRDMACRQTKSVAFMILPGERAKAREWLATRAGIG
jgi:hypothetical protein